LHENISICPQVVGVVGVKTLSSRQYCVILDPIGADGKPQLGKKKLVKGEKSFFLQPGEKLENGIQDVYVLGEDEGLILRCVEAFDDGKVCFFIFVFLLALNAILARLLFFMNNLNFSRSKDLRVTGG
jgi:hypothetical protein